MKMIEKSLYSFVETFCKWPVRRICLGCIALLKWSLKRIEILRRTRTQTKYLSKWIFHRQTTGELSIEVNWKQEDISSMAMCKGWSFIKVQLHRLNVARQPFFLVSVEQSLHLLTSPIALRMHQWPKSNLSSAQNGNVYENNFIGWWFVIL